MKENITTTEKLLAPISAERCKMSVGSLLKSMFAHSITWAVGQGQPEPEEPVLNQGMPVEVMRDFDTVLLFGRLTAAGPMKLTIGRVPGEAVFPAGEVDGVVLVRGYDAQMDPILLRGTVLQCSEAVCTVGDLVAIPYETQRKRVRYPLCPPADACALDDEEQGPPQLCQLLNISTGGACVVSSCVYRVEQQLYLRVRRAKDDGYSTYRCRVMRVTPRRGGFFEYGLFFTHMDKRERSGLMEELRAIQAEMEKKLRS